MSISPDNSWIFKNTLHHLHLSELFERLQYEGIAVNVSDYSSIQTILKNAKPDISPEELSSLLCPLLAKSPEEQEKFQQIFKECIAAPDTEVSLADEGFELEPEAPQISVLARYKFALGMLAILLIGITSLVFWQNKKPFLQEVNPKKIKIKTTSDDRLLENLAIQTPKPNKPILEEKDKPRKADNEAKDVKPVELGNGKFQLLSLKAEDISLYKAEQLWWYTYKILIKWWFVAMIIGGFLVFEAYYFAKKKLIAKLQTKNEPDDLLSLSLALKSDYTIKYPIQNLHKIAYKLRLRAVDFQTTRIDTKQTVANTIKNVGIVSPVYQSVSKQTEYLVLVSQSARRGHQWNVFDFTLKELAKQDLSVVRFYFNETPEQCWDERTHKPVSIKYLQTHYPAHRLIIFGEASYFVQGNQPNPIVSELNAWEEVVLMTPKEQGLWAKAEELLQNHLPIVHANLDGFGQIADYYSLNTHQLGKAEAQPSEVLDLEEETEIVLANLEYYLLPKLPKNTAQPNLLTWIAGCCILPQLSWELTLFVGNFLSSEENQLLTVDHLTRLAGLAWFQQNEIPLWFKERLLADESIISADLKSELTEAILMKIEASMNKKQMASMSSKSRAFLLLSKWQIATEKGKKAIEKGLKNLWLTSPEVRDMPQVISLLRQQASGVLDFLIPEKYQKYFFNHDFSFSGIRLSARVLIALFLLAIPLFLLQPSEYFCANPIAYQDDCYCIEDDYKLAQLLNKNAADQYNSGNASTEVLSLLDSASHARSGYATSEHNKAIFYYNELARQLNDGNAKDALELYEKIQSFYPTQEVLGKEWAKVQEIFGE